MSTWLSEREERLVEGAEELEFKSPVPTQIVSNGEYLPPPQSPKQKQVESRIKELAEENSKYLGMTRREYLMTNCGMAAAFLAMNEVYGTNVWQVDPAEARDPEMTKVRADDLSGQFIFDDQTHFLRDDFSHEEITGLGEFAAEHWNPVLKEEGISLTRYKFENYIRELWCTADTKMALLSGAPFDDPTWYLLYNDQIMQACDTVNDFAVCLVMPLSPRVTQDGWTLLTRQLLPIIQIWFPGNRIQLVIL